MPSTQRSIPRNVVLTRLAAPAMLLLTIALAACGSGDASPTATPAASSPSITTSPPAPGATRTPAGSDLRNPTAIPELPTAAVTVTANTPSLPDRPPAARAIAGSSSIELTRGSFVWNGVQADAFRVTTSTDRLTTSAGATIVVPNPAPLPLASADAGFVAATDQPRTTEAGRLEWPYGAFTRAGIATIAGDEVRITAPADPGTYVGTVILRYDAASQAYYHFLLDVN